MLLVHCAGATFGSLVKLFESIHAKWAVDLCSTFVLADWVHCMQVGSVHAVIGLLT